MDYPPTVAALLTNDAFEHYTQSRSGNQEVLALLQSLGPADIQESLGNSGSPDGSNEMAQACISGLWLLHNFLNESHDISQSIDSPVGSHWHAIMHRMEGDYSNSKYWYRRAGHGSLYDEVSHRSGQPFDPATFVDQVQTHGSDATRAVAVAEWHALFEFCFREATHQ